MKDAGEKPAPDDMDLETVAARLGKSASWLRGELAKDRKLPEEEQKLTYHHYIGRSPRWMEEEYQQLRAALSRPSPPRRQPREDAADPLAASPSSSTPATGGWSAGCTMREALGASARVQGFPRRPKTSQPPKNVGVKQKAPSEPASPASPVLPYRPR